MFYWWAINISLTSRLPDFIFRSCPPHRSRLKAVLYPRHIPRSPVRRSPAPVRTCPATRSRRLPCRQPARDLLLLPRPQPRSPSTGIRAGPRTTRAAAGGMHHRSVSASYQTTPPGGMWRRFTSSSVHCQVSGVNTDPPWCITNTQTHTRFAYECCFKAWLTTLCPSSSAVPAGCQEIADEFRSQEIDGQALLLLKEDHLMSTMNIKLGPALKIFARINMLKDS